jgi:hypothetical protein
VSFIISSKFTEMSEKDRMEQEKKDKQEKDRMEKEKKDKFLPSTLPIPRKTRPRL